jgi:hypothetical protein
LKSVIVSLNVFPSHCVRIQDLSTQIVLRYIHEGLGMEFGL